MQLPRGYTIASAASAHTPLLAAIETAAASIFPACSFPEHLRSDSVPENVLLEAVQQGLLWVVFAGGKRPVGYALVQLVEDAALLAQIDVHPDHMRRGIGSALVCHVIAQLRLRKQTNLYLTTFRHIPWNAPFYAKLGFKILEEGNEPLFINNILEKEKVYGLKDRIGMHLSLKSA